MKDFYNKIIGCWIIDPLDKHSKQLFGDVELEFTKDGNLIYTIHESSKDQHIFLNFWIIDDLLITDQTSHPKKEETKIEITPEGKLKLFFQGVESCYIKETKDRSL